MIPSTKVLSANDAPSPRRAVDASPMTTYRTSRYNRKAMEIGERYPVAQLLLARDLYGSNADWQREWPLLVPILTELVFFAEIDGMIGFGVWSEVHDVTDRILVWFLDDATGWRPLADVVIDILGESMARFAQVVVPITQPHAADA